MLLPVDTVVRVSSPRGVLRRAPRLHFVPSSCSCPPVFLAAVFTATALVAAVDGFRTVPFTPVHSGGHRAWKRARIARRPSPASPTTAFTSTWCAASVAAALPFINWAGFVHLALAGPVTAARGTPPAAVRARTARYALSALLCAAPYVARGALPFMVVSLLGGLLVIHAERSIATGHAAAASSSRRLPTAAEVGRAAAGVVRSGNELAAAFQRARAEEADRSLAAAQAAELTASHAWAEDELKAWDARLVLRHELGPSRFSVLRAQGEQGATPGRVRTRDDEEAAAAAKLWRSAAAKRGAATRARNKRERAEAAPAPATAECAHPPRCV